MRWIIVFAAVGAGYWVPVWNGSARVAASSYAQQNYC